MTGLMLIFYEWVLVPLGVGILFLASFFVPKIREGFRLRSLDSRSDRNLKNCVWIHVSSGEWEYAKPVARLLKARGESILVTHFSPSVRKSLENSPEIDAFFALPFDNRLFLKSFFKRFSPRVLLIARTDLWPVLLKESKKRGIKRILFSARLSPEILKNRSRLAKFLAKTNLDLLDQVYCVSEDDKASLSQLTSTVQVLGDTRYDQAVFRMKNQKSLKNILDPNFVYLVAGSIWPADEAVLIPIIASLQKQSRLRFILVPHEPMPAHLKNLNSKLESHQLRTHLYSQTQNSQWTSGSENILVIDQIGILAELYLRANLAFVGNSFEKHAVHSVMEPLAAGCLTFVGPFYKNNREAIEFSRFKVGANFTAVEVIADSRSLAAKLQVALEQDLPTLQKLIRTEVEKRTGASSKLLNLIT